MEITEQEKTLDNKKAARRSMRVPFLAIETNKDTVEYVRMKGFTKFGRNTNVKTQELQFIDEDFSRNQATSKSLSIDYEFLLYEGNIVHKTFEDIHMSDECGQTVNILWVDMTHYTTGASALKGTLREYTVNPKSDADDVNLLMFKGTLDACGKSRLVAVALPDGRDSLTATISD